jgi:hypothetical protein
MTEWMPSDTSMRRALIGIGPPLLLAVAFLGPALGFGALMNLDLIVLPHLDVPAAFFGIGPELPRRVPLWALIGAVSPVIPATVTVKALLVATFVISWTGMVRWATRLGVRRPAMAAALYTLSPLLLTRLGIGHLGLVLAAGILPWVAAVLLDPLRNRAHLFLAAGAMGLCGYHGGVLALVTVVISVWFRAPVRPGRALGAIAIAVAAQIPWLAPTISVALSVSVEPTSAVPFGVNVGDNPLGVLSLSAGNGYWNTYFQVGTGTAAATVVGALLFALAIAGVSRLPSDVRRPLTTLGVATWVIAALSAWSGFDGVFRALTSNPIGGLLRDPQRLLVLHLLWLAPSACLGAGLLSSRLPTRIAGAAMALPIAAVVTIATPGLWGLDGNLDAEPVPTAWNEARDLVRSSPGPTLALPWAQYLNQELSGQPLRRVLNPMPYLLGGDVLSSSDTRLEADVREAGDPREPSAAEGVAALVEDGTPIAPLLQRLGVRWVVLQTTSELADRYTALRDDPGLEVVLERPELTVFTVAGWSGVVRSADGKTVRTDQIGHVAYRLHGTDTGPAIVARAASRGWLQGWSSTSITDDGLLAVPRDRGTVWHPGTTLTMIGYLGFIVAIARCTRQKKM